MEQSGRRERSGEFLLRTNLQSIMILGDGPIDTADVATYKQRLAKLHKRALSEDSLLDELIYANYSSPWTSRNGMRLWVSENATTDMLDHSCEVSSSGSNVRLIDLDPSRRMVI